MVVTEVLLFLVLREHPAVKIQVAVVVMVVPDLMVVKVL